ncbi:hypothetical protein RND81_13G166200 [Saponaria officinalis]|uniref:Endonuclease/exonuclease/phosphatase domain-containing protein n=1 Tax=Saponaria officinalis TaxID=3572 RepID=A0AAW1GYN2_SAPOF
MDGFRHAINDCGLRDLGYEGDPFTWKRGNCVDNIIRERLDRFLATDDWCSLFPNSQVTHFPQKNSDHSLILLDVSGLRAEGNDIRGRRGFRFEAFWADSSDCEEIVQRHWKLSTEDPHGKIVCARELKKWA